MINLLQTFPTMKSFLLRNLFQGKPFNGDLRVEDGGQENKQVGRRAMVRTSWPFALIFSAIAKGLFSLKYAA